MTLFPSKITIFGPPGSGKTTLAIKLGQSTHLPVFHLDKLLWETGWVLRPQQDFLQDHQKLIDQETWIIEGTSRKTLDIRYPLSDLVIFLNPPRLVCLYRVLKRFLLTRSPMPDKAEGCEERVTWEFIKYLWRFKKPASNQIDRLKVEYPHTKLIEIESIRGARNANIA